MSKAASDLELKFALTSAEAARLKRLAWFRPDDGENAEGEHLVSVYYDTDDRTLHEAGVSLRLRRKKSGFVQTIKAASENGTLFSRREIETPVKEDSPNLARLRKAMNGGWPEQGRLKPLFETRVNRTRTVVEHGGTVAELAIDEGEVAAGKDTAPLCELELELRRGDPADLFEIARELGRSTPLRPAWVSKAERGYRLLGETPVPTANAEEVVLRRGMNVGEALQTVSRSCVRQIVGNEEAARAGDPHGVHQMRIGIRRLRSAMVLFRPMLSDERTEQLRADLKWLAKELGAARDAHVFLADVLQPLKEQSLDEAGLDDLFRDFEGRRIRAERKAGRVLTSQRYRDLIFDVCEWVEAGDWLRSDDPLVTVSRDSPVKPFAVDELARRTKKLIKRARKLGELDPPHRHRVRIQAKKLRYATEFFSSLFRSKKRVQRCDDALQALKRLQDALGELNDIATRETMMRNLAAPNRKRAQGNPDRAFAAGIVFAAEDAKTAHLLQRATKAAADLAAAEPYWS